MWSESGSKVGVCKCRASKLVMSTSCHEKRNLRKKTDPFFSLLHHHTQQFYSYANKFVVRPHDVGKLCRETQQSLKQNSGWFSIQSTRFISTIVTKLRDIMWGQDGTLFHWMLLSIETRVMLYDGKGRLNRLLMIWNWVACSKAWELMIWKIGYMPKLSSKTGHWKFEYMPKTKLPSLWLGNWVHTKKLGFKAYDGKLSICQN